MSTTTRTTNGGTLRALLFCFAALLCMSMIVLPVAATKPVAGFSADPLSGTTPLTVQFTDTSTNTPTGWTWAYRYKPIGGSFGSYTTFSTDQNPVYTFSSTGGYIIRLTAANSDGSNAKTQGSTSAPYITVNPAADPDLDVTNIYLKGGNIPFAREPNTVQVTVKNIGGSASGATMLELAASDGFATTADVPALESQASVTLTIEDTTVRDLAGDSLTYTATADPGNTITEADETNNGMVGSYTVAYNGYKGVQYWAGKEAPKTYLTFDLHGNIIHSFGDSAYMSGKSSDWQTLTWHYTASDLPVPAGATVRAVRLYIPYCWDYEHEISGGLTATTFNGITVNPVHQENDTSNFGGYAQFEYGLVTYDVTPQFLKNGDNVVTFTRTYWDTSPGTPGTPGSLSPAGFTVAVVYEDPSETRKQIFVNEGWDLLGASVNDYSTTEEEATSYQEYTGMTIDMARAAAANLTTFVPWGSPQDPAYEGEGNLYVNGAEAGTYVWDYGGSGWGANGLPQVAVDTRNVLSHLNPGGTGNVIAIQSTAGGSPCMVAERSFLVVEYPEETPVPEFPMVAFPVLVIGALAAVLLVYRRR